MIPSPPPCERSRLRERLLPAPLELAEHRLEVVQLLARQLRERARQLRTLRVAEDQRQRGAGGLLLGVGVVQQDRVDVGQGPVEPGGSAAGRQVQHGAGV